jgi:hypothetical protein
VGEITREWWKPHVHKTAIGSRWITAILLPNISQLSEFFSTYIAPLVCEVPAFAAPFRHLARIACDLANAAIIITTSAQQQQRLRAGSYAASILSAPR